MTRVTLDTYECFLYTERTQTENNFTRQNLLQLYNKLPNTKQVIVTVTLYDFILRVLTSNQPGSF